jgi:hypothetical protein
VKRAAVVQGSPPAIQPPCQPVSPACRIVRSEIEHLSLYVPPLAGVWRPRARASCKCKRGESPSWAPVRCLFLRARANLFQVTCSGVLCHFCARFQARSAWHSWDI